MNFMETVIGGTIQPDGTLVLDEKPSLPLAIVALPCNLG